MVPKGLRKINIETKKIKIIRKRILSKKKEGEKKKERARKLAWENGLK